MGRLTLNILLSFAQFEREIISERTRDKMSAARKKGKWVGGMLILGYDRDPKGSRIVVNKREAERVRAIFELYLNRQSLIPVVEELNERGWKTKQWITKKDKVRGGKLFTKHYLYSLLTNIVYIGKIIYKGTIYEGEQEAIVTPEVWQKVQELLKRNGLNKGANVRNKHGALLKGILYCVPCGKPMMHTFSIRKNGHQRYHYYVCMNAQQRGWDSCPSKSLNAHEIECAVVENIRGLGSNEKLVAETVKQVREQSEKRWQELNRERLDEEKGLQRMHSKLRQLVSEISPGGDNRSPDTVKLADLQDRIRSAEQRMTQLREELLAVERESLDPGDLAHALAIFDPVWASLNSREQSRILHLLLDRVGYDGSTGKVSINFKSHGIKELASGRTEDQRCKREVEPRR
jgi:site-specific DNA recombinase